jgi:hypothetical protein
MMNSSEVFQQVLQDIIRVTHCHGCGTKINVCFYGYAGEYCSKGCYKNHDREADYESDEEDELEQMWWPRNDAIRHDYETCGWCQERRLSYANSVYHHISYCYQNSSGHIWPMLHPSIPCDNECIQLTSTIRIPGYNY